MDAPLITAYKTAEYRVFLVRRWRISSGVVRFILTFAFFALLRYVFFRLGWIPSLK
jgi:hypothetical protein